MGNIIVTGGEHIRIDLCHANQKECEADGCAWNNNTCFSNNNFNETCTSIKYTKCSAFFVS